MIYSSNNDIMNLPNSYVKHKMERYEIHSFCITQRNAINQSCNLKMLISNAWTQRRQNYVDFIFIDGKGVTNEEYRTLFKIPVRNYIMEQVVILRSVLTNNKCWKFR